MARVSGIASNPKQEAIIQVLTLIRYYPKMKLKLGENLFDEYSWKARVLPALITLAPVAIICIILGWLNILASIISLAASLGLIFFLAQLTRTLGKKTETKLTKQWGGLPTTQALRHATQQNATVFKIRRANIESLLGIKLPSRQAERRNPLRCDEHYEAATKSIISKVRAKREQFPRVHEENINYGFRRNLLGLKTIGLGINATIIIYSLLSVLIIGLESQILLILFIGLLFAVLWLFVNPRWVQESANSYADRLLETLEEGL